VLGGFSSLALPVLGVLTDHPDDAPPFYNFTLSADFSDRRSHLHL